MLKPFTPSKLPLKLPRYKGVKIPLKEAYAALEDFKQPAHTATFQSRQLFSAKRFSKHLVCSIHRSFKIKGARSKRRVDQYRKKQNWIGPHGGPKEKAYFFPPPADRVEKMMSNWIAYCNRKEKEPLIQLAIAFAQLLIIHPFMDGNGRVARALIPFFLFKKGLIPSPHLFLDDYFKKYRLAYFRHLFEITSENDWKQWILFFLKGIKEEAHKECRESGNSPRRQLFPKKQ